MVVSLIISDVLDGVQLSDSLQGGGTGADLGSIATGSYGPVTNKAANTGAFDLYIRHDGTAEIFGLKTFIQTYGEGTAFTYGGGDTAANDFATMKSLGNLSGNSKNNLDGNSGGLWVDMDWNASDTTRFDQANFPTLVKIYGDNNTDGIDLSSAFDVVADAMVFDNLGAEDAPSAPEDGKIGPQASPAVLGDNAHLKLRQYLPSGFGQNGYFQFEYVAAYSYTA